MENRVEFDYIRRKDGSSLFEEFLESLPEKDQAKLLAVIHNTEEMGLETAKRMQWIKKLDDDLFELRSKVGSNIQRAIYFQKIGDQYLITHGFTKKSQKTPPKEISKAKDIRDRYKRGNK